MKVRGLRGDKSFCVVEKDRIQAFELQLTETYKNAMLEDFSIKLARALESSVFFSQRLRNRHFIKQG